MPFPEGIRSILFSLPTICDAAPETIPNLGDGGEAFRVFTKTTGDRLSSFQ
jgi:hypothetical protein